MNHILFSFEQKKTKKNKANKKKTNKSKYNKNLLMMIIEYNISAWQD